MIPCSWIQNTRMFFASQNLGKGIGVGIGDVGGANYHLDELLAGLDSDMVGNGVPVDAGRKERGKEPSIDGLGQADFEAADFLAVLEVEDDGNAEEVIGFR